MQQHSYLVLVSLVSMLYPIAQIHRQASILTTRHHHSVSMYGHQLCSSTESKTHTSCIHSVWSRGNLQSLGQLSPALCLHGSIALSLLISTPSTRDHRATHAVPAPGRGRGTILERHSALPHGVMGDGLTAMQVTGSLLSLRGLGVSSTRP